MRYGFKLKVVRFGLGLSNEQLLEVFKQTSSFNVKSAMAGNDSLRNDADFLASFDRCPFLSLEDCYLEGM